jgi:hypothetical protein
MKFSTLMAKLGNLLKMLISSADLSVPDSFAIKELKYECLNHPVLCSKALF